MRSTLSPSRRSTTVPFHRWVLAFLFVILLGATASIVSAQWQNSPTYGPSPAAIPTINIGANAQAAQFATLDFAEMILDQQNRGPNGKEMARQRELVQSGGLSELDLAAPDKAVNEFNQASALLRGQHSQDAVDHLQKAIILYPKFVSAHNYLGLAYQDADNPTQARSEFQTAADLDAKFARSFVNLGRLCLSQSDFVAAQAQPGKGGCLAPIGPRHPYCAGVCPERQPPVS